jgi:hypothetical protein
MLFKHDAMVFIMHEGGVTVMQAVHCTRTLTFAARPSLTLNLLRALRCCSVVASFIIMSDCMAGDEMRGAKLNKNCVRD